MKRQYFAFAIGSLLVLSPAALAQQSAQAPDTASADTGASSSVNMTNPFAQYATQPQAPKQKKYTFDMNAPIHFAVPHYGSNSLVTPIAAAPTESAPLADEPAPDANRPYSEEEASARDRVSPPAESAPAAAVAAARDSTIDCGDSCPEYFNQSAAAAGPQGQVQQQQGEGANGDLVSAVNQASNIQAPLQMAGQEAPNSCLGYDERGSEGLKEKGLSRIRKIDAILNETTAHANDVASAAPGSVNSLKKADALRPAGLEAKAKCELVLPNEMSAGLGGVELEYGAGAYRCRDASNNWEQGYHFVQLKGANLGFQIGGKVTDRVLYFMNDSAVEKLQHLDVKVGLRAGAAVGPWGRDASIATSFNLKDDIRSYSQSKGLYVGINLEGAVIHPDKNMDASVYGNGVTKHKHNWFGVFHFGHRNICAASSDQQAPNQVASTQQALAAQSEQATQSGAATDNGNNY